MNEWLIRGDDDEPDLGLSEPDARLALGQADSRAELYGHGGWYRLRLDSVELQFSDEVGFGWQVTQTTGTAEAASPIIEEIAKQIGERLGRPVRVVQLS